MKNDKKEEKKGFRTRPVSFNVKFTQEEKEYVDKTFEEIGGKKHEVFMKLVEFYRENKHKIKK